MLNGQFILRKRVRSKNFIKKCSLLKRCWDYTENVKFYFELCVHRSDKIFATGTLSSSV